MVSDTNGHNGASSSDSVVSDGVQRGLRRQGVAGGRVGVGAPEAPPAAADVPVGEVVDEVGQGGRRRQRLVASSAPRSPSPSCWPAGTGSSGRAAPGRRPPGSPASAGSNSFSDAYVVKKLNVFHSVSSMSRMAVSMAPSVARVGVHGEPWLNIHQRMASAPRVSRIDQGSMMLPSDLDILRPSASTMWPEAHHVAVGALAEDQRVDGQQRVEPAPGLVDGLGDEVGREGEGLGRARRVRVADLGRRHGARVEPGVDHRLDPAAHRQLVDLVDRPDVGRARPAGERHLVDGRPVRVDPRDVAPAQVRQLGQRADAAHVAPPAAPDRQRRAPVAVARQGPVDVVLQPLAEAPVLDVRRVPVHASGWPPAGRPCGSTWRCTSSACPSR